MKQYSVDIIIGINHHIDLSLFATAQNKSKSGDLVGCYRANCPAVFLSYFSLLICYEIQLTADKSKDPNEPNKSAEKAN